MESKKELEASVAMEARLLDDDNSAFEKLLPPNKKIHRYNEHETLSLIEAAIAEAAYAREQVQILADNREPFLLKI